MNDQYDDRLIGRIAAGDERAMAEFYAIHARTLFNFAARVLQSRDEAEEAVTGVFLSVRTGVPPWPSGAPDAGGVLAARLRDSLLSRIRGTPRRPDREVDLWSVANARGTPDPGLDAARQAIRRCGVVSAAVLTLVYFGGYGIPEAASRLSMTEAECRARLQMCLENIAGRGAARANAAHGGKFLVNAAAWALGAVTPRDEPGFAEHLQGGCTECAAEISRYAASAQVLPRLLPDRRLPEDLLEKILFSLRLADVTDAMDASSGASPAAAPPGEERPGSEAARLHAPAAAADPGIGRAGGMHPWSLAAAVAVTAVAFLLWYTGDLRAKLDERAELIESLQDAHTQLMLRYDRLAGISGFFESKGVVTVLSGAPGYPGLSGKIVWDTTGGSAMLQILHPPEELENGRFRVKAIGEDAAVEIAEFRGDGRDTGDVIYRFFPVDVAPEFPAEGFAVDVAPAASGGYRDLLRGDFPGRH